MLLHMKLKKRFLTALLALLLVHAAPAQEVADPDGWFGVSLGLTSIDAQVGYYDLLARRLHGRVIASYVYGGGFLVNADMLLSTGSMSGFYLGLGPGFIVAPYSSLGANIVIGGDIPLNTGSGILIDGSFGFYPFFLTTAIEEPGMILPFFARLGVGYRLSF